MFDNAEILFSIKKDFRIVLDKIHSLEYDKHFDAKKHREAILLIERLQKILQY